MDNDERFGASEKHINEQRIKIIEYVKNANEGVQRVIVRYEECGYDLIFVNDYHMVFCNGDETDVVKFEGICDRFKQQFITDNQDRMIQYMEEKGIMLEEVLPNGLLFKFETGNHRFVSNESINTVGPR